MCYNAVKQNLGGALVAALKKYHVTIPVCILWLGLACGVVFASPRIQVQGLFKNSAVFLINGKQQILKAGRRSPEGVLLIESDSQYAVIEINGHRQKLYLGKEIGAVYDSAKENVVRVAGGHNGHFVPQGKINGRPTQFMVDTGASTISMSSIEAQRLGLSYKNGRLISVSTANGIVQGYVITLNTVSVGTITLNAIEAVILEGRFPDVILLGNSFLSRVDMRFEEGVLVLTTMY